MDPVDELAELRASADLRWQADMRAIKAWGRAHPTRKLVWPDHADLVVWLIERLEECLSQQETEKDA